MSERQESEAARERRSLAEVLERTFGQVEKSVEEAVGRSLAKIKVPRRETLQELNARLDRLERRLQALEGDGKAG